MKRKTALKLIFSLVLMVWVLRAIDAQGLLHLLTRLDLTCVSGAIALSTVGILLSVWKWSLLQRAFRQPTNPLHLLRLFWIGLFFNNILPGRTGGDIIRIYGIAPRAKGLVNAVFSVAADRILNLIALVTIGIVSSCFFPEIAGTYSRVVYGIAAAGCLAVLILTVVIAHSPGFLERFQNRCQLLNRVSSTVQPLLRYPRIVLAAFILAGLYQFTMILGNFVIARALHLDISVEIFICLIPLTALVTLIPVSLNGIGLREGAYAFIFSQAGIPPETAVAISIVATGCMMGLSLIGGILYAVGPIQTKTQPGKPASTSPIGRTLGPQFCPEEGHKLP